MNNFSVTSCYAVLSVLNKDSLLKALLEMVIALVDDKKYDKLDPQTLSNDFNQLFHFLIPYHPMQVLIKLGIESNYFVYNKAIGMAQPIWENIDSGEFMTAFKRQEAAYAEILERFDLFLQKKYSLHVAKEGLSEQVQTFIQRYGLAAKFDRSIMGTAKNDFYFADFLLDCINRGDESVLNYVDNYTVGCSFAEYVTFCAPVSSNNRCQANVYLDSGFIFSLLGISSKDRSEPFEELLTEMRNLGMHPCIFKHTYSEISDIIDNARGWIGNAMYAPSKASETAYFFITNGWSYQKATELLGDLKSIITEEYHIKIVDCPYPKVEDISTLYQEKICEQIIAEYQHSNPNFSAQDKARTIEYDSRSLFLTLHLNGKDVAHTLPDIRNIFVTTNHSLAKVGGQLSNEYASGATTYIPIALTDLAWGFLVWSNSPSKVSQLNKSKIVSAAYAAFRPSEAILARLEKTLSDCQERGDLSPEKCYFLKTDSLALNILSNKTRNDETRYSEKLPFEILKELQETGYKKGLEEKQTEVDKLTKERDNAVQAFTEEKQYAETQMLYNRQKFLQQDIGNLQEQRKLKSEYFESMERQKIKADQKAKKQLCAIIMSILVVFLVAIVALSKIEKYAWIVTVISVVLALISILLECFSYKGPFTRLQKFLEKKAYCSVCFNERKFSELAKEIENIDEKLLSLKGSLTEVENGIKNCNCIPQDFLETFSK